MKITRSFLYVLLMLTGLSWQLTAAAQSKPLPSATQYSEEGADTCLGCHDEDEGKYKAKALFKTKHAARGDKRSPFGMGGLQCEACHGPGALHARNKKGAAINNFKADGKQTLDERNQVCMTCHQGTTRTAWHAGAHARADLACTDCHKVHQEHDPVLAKVTESQVCMSCHKQTKADFLKASAHPVNQGKMACSDCHSAHGSSAPAMLVKATLNQTCYSCHAEKRGPMLWEHAPVAEDCASCHTPHGSVRAALLTKTPPLLCQQCHTTAGHPSVSRTGAALPGGTAGGTGFLIAGSCSNCHTQVHGSNHPAGSKLMR